MLVVLTLAACGDEAGKADPEGELGGTQKPMVLAPGWVTGSSWPTETVVALNSVALRSTSLVKGSVGVVTRATGAVLSNNAELSIATNAEVTGNVRADTIQMDVAGHVLGAAAYNQLAGTGTIDGAQTASLTVPVPITIVAASNFSAGSSDINVSSGSSSSRSQGSYDDVTLASGDADDKTVLRLNGGTYRIDNLTLGNHARVECRASCEIRIKSRLTVGSYSFIGPYGSSNQNMGQVKLFVEGTNGVQTPSGTPAAASIGQWSELKAFTFVPNGTLALGANVTGVGKFIAKDVDVGTNTELLDGSSAQRVLTLPYWITGASWPNEVITAYNSIDLLSNTSIDGNAVVITNGSGFLNGAEAVLGNSARLNGNLRADRIVLNAGSQVAGAAVYNSMTGSGTAGSRVSPLSLPLPIRVPAFPVISSGSSSYSVSARLDRTLAPGRYRDVTLGSGISSDRTTLTLTGGVYEMRRLTLGNHASLTCAAACEIRVSDRVSTGDYAFVGPGAGLDASAVQMFVYRDNGSANSTPFAVSFGTNSDNEVFVFAPRGTLEGKSGASLRGRYVAKNIRLGSSSTSERTGDTELPPEIQEHPQSLTVVAAESATFSVRASGSDIGFQWNRNGAAIAGATGGSYTLANPVLADNGAVFTVTVSNLAGTLTSSPAVLTVDACDPDTFVPVATNCGVGACARTGMRTCVDGAIINSCVAGTPAASDASCDGIDNDCSGSVDEDFVPAVTHCGEGVCQDTGMTSCVAGVVRDSCEELAPAANDATCDGRDDDCDGDTDEDFVAVASTCGVGACRRTGVVSCVDGAVFDSCEEGEPGASDSDCDNIDDDCDGEADQDYESVDTTCGIGACQAHGSTDCVGGVVVNSCRAGNNAPSDTSCDEVDDDCDGDIDEDYVAVSTSCGVGACARTGATSCVSGEVQNSCTPGSPAANDASCNGVDNDCNGQVDEDYVPVATTCGSGMCTAAGVTSCVSGSVQNSCVVPSADGDGDGAPDCSDGCPTDPAKISAGVCGCNQTELDSDADGSPDCADVCPLDALDDLDGDGVCADEDNCAEVGNPTQSDTDDDGVGDACDAPFVVASSGGGAHVCALLSDMTVSCWGANYAGQLGNGSTAVSSATPVVAAGLTGVTQLSAGYEHTCARVGSGAVYCWGANGSGQLGTGAGAGATTPSLVLGLSDATQVAAGHDHTCARRSSGEVVCWGANASGQLGDGSAAVSASTPVTVLSLSDATEVASGYGHSCALRSTGAVVCWGANWYGEIGSDALALNATTNVPMQVAGLSDATAIAAGGLHSCARRASGAVVCWGFNMYGQLGNGSRTDASTPVSAGLSDATSLRGGLLHTCAVRAGGTVACWGYNAYGQVGNGAYADQDAPATLLGLHNVIDVAPGDTHTCGVRTNGEVSCWGDASAGQLGGSAVERAVRPTTVVGVSDANRVAVGAAHVCTQLAAGSVRCWGLNEYGQLGNGDNLPATTASNVTGLTSVSMVVSGFVHTCAMTTSGDVYCWGRGADGQLGNGAVADSMLPVRVTGLSGVTRLAAGGNHSCAILSGGAVRCWGEGGEGQLGQSALTDASAPVAVAGLTGAVELALGASHSCALLQGGGLRCWGDGSFGQLGHGSVSDALTPVAVTGINNAMALAAGTAHTCAVLADGTVRCWGEGRTGALGHGSAAKSSTPVAVTGIANAEWIAAGSDHACVVLSSAQVRCWGDNAFGQLGDGTLTTARSPVVTDGLFDVVRLAAGYQNTCAVHADGAVSCWGSGGFGQLGNGYPFSASPVRVQW